MSLSSDQPHEVATGVLADIETAAVTVVNTQLAYELALAQRNSLMVKASEAGIAASVIARTALVTHSRLIQILSAPPRPLKEPTV